MRNKRKMQRIAALTVAGTGVILLVWSYKPGQAASDGPETSLRTAPRSALPVAASILGPTVANAAEPEAPKSTITVSPPAPTESPATQPATELEVVSPATKPSDVLTESAGLRKGPYSDAALKFEQLAEAGNLVAAREVGNGLIIPGAKFTETDIRPLLIKINQKLVFSPMRAPGDELVDSVTVKSGDRLEKIAATHNIPWEFIARINGISDPKRIRVGQTLKVIKGPLHAVVRKGRFEMDLYAFELPREHSATTAPSTEAAEPSKALYLTTFKVGLGADDSTPTGLWKVAADQKLKNPTYFSPRGQGVIAADDPKNPLGEFWIGLTGLEGNALGKTSYGIHGTIEPDSLGKQSSMGCVRLADADIALVFEMLTDGKSLVRIEN